MPIRFLNFLFLFLFGSQSLFAQGYCIAGRFSETAYFDSSEVRVDSSVQFANPVHAFTHVSTPLVMDIFYPDTSLDSLPLRPFILLIHGGAFLAGTRQDMYYECMEYARRGFVAATMDYRLGWNCAATDFLNICILCANQNADIKRATYCAVQDARAALRFISANAATYAVDTNALFIGGESAGSITALQAAFWDQSEANAFDPGAPGQAGLLDTAGNSFPSGYSLKAVVNSCGAVTKDSIVLNNGNIPVISFHDEFDCIVPPQYGQVISCVCQPFYWVAGSSPIYSLLTNNGICSEYHMVPASINHCSFPKPQLVADASCFIKRILCNSCQSGFSNQPYDPATCSSLNTVNELSGSVAADFSFTNPSQGKIVISFTEAPHSPVEIRVADHLGRVLLEELSVAPESRLDLDLTAFTSGLYVLSLHSGSNIQSRKLILIK